MDTDALRSPDRATALRALRDVLVDRLDAAKPGESAPIAKQLADVLDRLDAIKVPEESNLDDLSAARAKRRAALPDASAGRG